MFITAVNPENEICSAKGCTDAAVHALLWNNPKIHTPERRKNWLACAAHRQSLADFLTARGFLKDIVDHPHVPSGEATNLT